MERWKGGEIEGYRNRGWSDRGVDGQGVDEGCGGNQSGG